MFEWIVQQVDNAGNDIRMDPSDSRGKHLLHPGNHPFVSFGESVVESQDPKHIISR